jgi:outer membrane protein assembly factor BamB
MVCLANFTKLFFGHVPDLMSSFQVMRIVLLAYAAIGPWLGGPSRADDSKHRAQLVAQGIEPTTAGLHQFFSDVTSDQPNESVLQWIEQLGSAAYADRIEAQQYLMRQPQLPIERLKAATTSANPEVAYRAGIILKNWIPERERLIEAAFWCIADEKISELSTDIFKVATVFRDRNNIARAAEKALVSSVRATEIPQLIAHIEGHDSLLAHLALAAFVKLADESHKDRLLGWATRGELKESDRLRAALAVAELNDKRALRPMIELLVATDKSVALRANMILRNLTGAKITLATNDPTAGHATMERWNEWLANSNDSFELNLEQLKKKSGRSNLNGNMLLALGYKNRVVELNSNGEEVWSYDAQGVWSAEKMDSGDVLLACYQENRVKIVTPKKTVAWDYEIPGVLKAHILSNGNILAASHSANKILEISPEKKVVWEYNASTQCHDAQRLDNGNTLVCTQNEVLEVDPAGTVVWKFPAEQAYGIDILPEGNVLIAKLGGEVIEVDPSKNEILWKQEFQSPVDVYRTDEGTTLITGAQNVAEFDANKNPLWTKDICNFGSARK